MITKEDLVAGIRFAGERAASAAEFTSDWNYQLGHQWTAGDALRHVAATIGGLERLYPMLASESPLSSIRIAEVGAMNAKAIVSLREQSPEQVIAAIRRGSAAAADFVETLDEADLSVTVELGAYKMPKAEIVAQIWIHHPVAHAYEASARWPIL